MEAQQWRFSRDTASNSQSPSIWRCGLMRNASMRPSPHSLSKARILENSAHLIQYREGEVPLCMKILKLLSVAKSLTSKSRELIEVHWCLHLFERMLVCTACFVRRNDKMWRRRMYSISCHCHGPWALKLPSFQFFCWIRLHVHRA